MGYILLNILLAAVPAVTLLLFFYFKDIRKREPPLLVFFAFLLGFFAVFPALIIEFIIARLGASFVAPVSLLLRAFVIAGLVEEGVKLIVVRAFLYPRKAFDEVVDGMVYTITVSLGFAFFENILYSFGPPLVLIIRGVTAVPLHAIASGILGFHIGLAKSGKPKMMSRGLWIAVLVHGGYDFLLFTSSVFSILVIPILIFGAWYTLRLYKRAITIDEQEEPTEA